MTLAHAYLLEWDSQWFGIPIGRVDIPELTRTVSQEIRQWGVSQGLQCIYVNARHPTSEKFDGFDLLDTRIEYSFTLTPYLFDLSSVSIIEPLKCDDLESVCELCRHKMFLTRFLKDRRFQSARASEMYAEWIRSDFERGAPGCMVLRNANNIIGFITGSMDSDSLKTGKIGLIAVADGYRGAGIGGALLDGMLYTFSSMGLDCVTVATQDENIAASRLYTSRGAHLLSRTYWYHLWL